MRRRRPRRGTGRAVAARLVGGPSPRTGRTWGRPEVTDRRRRGASGPDPDPRAGPSADRGAERRVPRWNLVDPLVGFVLAQVLSALVAAVVVQTQAGRGAGVGIGLAGAFDGNARSLATGLSLFALALVQIPLWATEVGTVLFAGEVRGGGVRHDFGVYVRALDIPVGLAAGVAAQVVVSGGYALLDRLVGGLDTDQTARAIAAKGEGARVVAVLVLFALVGPFVEELFFRGLLMRAMERVTTKTVALIVTALIFAAIHFELLLLPGLFVAGLLFGYLAQRSGRLGPPIFAHVGFNAATIVLLAWSR